MARVFGTHRLYNVYEPLRVRLLDCTDNAVRQIVDLVGRPVHWPPWVQLG